MNIQEAIKTGRPLRREGWVNKEFRDFHEWTIDELDILANDWEVEPEKIETEISFADEDAEMEVHKEDDKIIIETMIKHERGYPIELSEEDVDKLLTFLYNNTKIGKSRVIPF